MAKSNCLKCGGQSFEMVHANNLEGSKRSVLFVQCAECGAVIGVLDFVNVGVQAAQARDDFQRMVDKLRARFSD